MSAEDVNFFQNHYFYTRRRHLPKNIVVFSGGTGQEGGVGISENIYESFRFIYRLGSC